MSNDILMKKTKGEDQSTSKDYQEPCRVECEDNHTENGKKYLVSVTPLPSWD
jgi:hypothetical protein